MEKKKFRLTKTLFTSTRQEILLQKQTERNERNKNTIFILKKNKWHFNSAGAKCSTKLTNENQAQRGSLASVTRHVLFCKF